MRRTSPIACGVRTPPAYRARCSSSSRSTPIPSPSHVEPSRGRAHDRPRAEAGAVAIPPVIAVDGFEESPHPWTGPSARRSGTACRCTSRARPPTPQGVRQDRYRPGARQERTPTVGAVGRGRTRTRLRPRRQLVERYVMPGRDRGDRGAGPTGMARRGVGGGPAGRRCPETTGAPGPQPPAGPEVGTDGDRSAWAETRPDRDLRPCAGDVCRSTVEGGGGARSASCWRPGHERARFAGHIRSAVAA